MHDMLGGYVERGELPGLVAVIERRGEVHVDCIGYPRDAIFRIASMTKPITAAAAMILVEEGVIRLDESVDRLLPELADRRVLRTPEANVDDTVPAARPITVRDLLTFTLGIGLIYAMPGTYPIQEAADRAGVNVGSGRKPATDEFLHRLRALPLMYQPGDAWMYNTGSDLLGILIARATGQTFGAFLRERVFEPLGMRDTGFWVPEEKVTRLPAAYTPETSGALKLEDEGARGAFSHPPALESGAGGLVSTIDDFLAFARVLLNSGRPVLARPAVETMITDHLTVDQKARSPWTPGYFATHGWGFGVAMVTRRYDIASTPGQYGWSGGFGTTWRNDPREDMITVLMTQVSMTSPQQPRVFGDFLTLAYAAIDD
jgi:CubicO group peptidase (beta-lactamase class C family)